MKNSAIRPFLLAIAVGIAGCGQRYELVVPEAKNDKPVVQTPAKKDPAGSNPKKEKPTMHKNHTHAFAAPEEMIEYLTKRKGELGPAKIVPQKVGFDDPELKPAGVDAVLTLDTWHHVKAREAYAKKVYDGLNRGGRFVVVEHEVDAEHGPPKAMRLAPGQVTKQLAAAGFRVEISQESMPRHYLVIGQKD